MGDGANAAGRLRAAGRVAGSLIVAGLICIALSTRVDALVPPSDGASPSPSVAYVVHSGSEASVGSSAPFAIPPTQLREIARITLDADMVQSRFIEIPAGTVVSALFACAGSAPLGWSATSDPSGDLITSAGAPSCDGSQGSGILLTRQQDTQAIEISFVGDPAPDSRAYVILLGG